MGERHSGDGPSGRRRAHPGGAVAAPEQASAGLPGLETRFGTALRARDVDAGAERGAVAAFRAAREAGAHDARTRARDDWRPGRPRTARRSLRTTLSLALASLALGGVAVAAIGAARSGPDDGGRHAPHPARPAPSAPAAPTADATAGDAVTGALNTGSAAPSRAPARPTAAGDTLAHCRAYARVGERGGALEATAWRRLVAAAGGRDRVAAYCAARTAPARTAPARAGNADTTDRPPASDGKGNGSGNSTGSGNGNGHSTGSGKGGSGGGDHGKPAGGTH
ncbi:hypothetical protein GCM10010501_37550 [Streptomyces libani subsp. rufus]|nr:hypothetical protein GCM10010501_37550 [Streptomyces libani subsp. rufus]